MADKEQDKKAPREDNLEQQDSVVESGTNPSAEDDSNSLSSENQSSVSDVEPVSHKKKSLITWITTRLNVYLLVFFLLLVVAGGAVLITYQQSKKGKNGNVNLQNLSDADLQAIQNSATKVGDPKSILNVESNAIFSGTVLVRDRLEVAGTIKVGGALSLPGITVSGTSAFDSVQINNLSISGNTQISGQLTVQKSLAVSGGATFGGTISAPKLDIQTLQVNNDLVISRHIDAGGPTPGVTFGGALGAGGTASVSGTDTAGTVTINTGSASPVGCFITVSFTRSFNATPHVVITPNDEDGASMSYYITRSSSSFSVCSASNPPDNVSFGFEYIAFD